MGLWGRIGNKGDRHIFLILSLDTNINQRYIKNTIRRESRVKGLNPGL